MLFPRLFGTLGCFANSPDVARRIKSANPLSVMYCLPEMLIVVSQPLRRQRHAVTSEIPASQQNLCRLIMGLPSGLMVDVVFMPSEYPLLKNPLHERHSASRCKRPDRSRQTATTLTDRSTLLHILAYFVSAKALWTHAISKILGWTAFVPPRPLNLHPKM